MLQTVNLVWCFFLGFPCSLCSRYVLCITRPNVSFHPISLTLLCSDTTQVPHFPKTLAVVLFHFISPFFWLILSHLLFLSLQTADLVEVPEEGNSSAGTLDMSRKRSNSGECRQARTAPSGVKACVLPVSHGGLWLVHVLAAVLVFKAGGELAQEFGECFLPFRWNWSHHFS